MSDEPKWDNLGNSLVIQVSRDFDRACSTGFVFRYDGQLCEIIEKSDRWNSGTRIRRLGKIRVRERVRIE